MSSPVPTIDDPDLLLPQRDGEPVVLRLADGEADHHPTGGTSASLSSSVEPTRTTKDDYPSPADTSTTGSS